MAFWLIAEKVLDIASELLDTDGDGDVDAVDVENLIERGEMYASVLGTVAMIDDQVTEKEEDEAWDILEKVSLSTLLTDELITAGNLTKREIKNRVLHKFQEPESIKKIGRYAAENQLEDKFYELACMMTIADGVVHPDERAFLDEFGQILELSKFDIRGIERKYLKQ